MQIRKLRLLQTNKKKTYKSNNSMVYWLWKDWCVVVNVINVKRKGP